MWIFRESGKRFPAFLAILILQAATVDAQWLAATETLPGYVEIENTAQIKDRSGLVRDTQYFMGYQFAVIGILYLMPESVTNWTDEQKEQYSMSIWWDNVTHPQWDSDDHFLNYVMHPYWGAAYYVRARERGYSPGESFWYSVLLSSLYEFGAEALFEEPSQQDLFVTPIVGSALGTFFMRVRNNVRARTAERGYRSTGDKWRWALTDPLGAANRQVDRWFGRDAELTVEPFLYSAWARDTRSMNRTDDSREWVAGLRVTLTW